MIFKLADKLEKRPACTSLNPAGNSKEQCQLQDLSKEFQESFRLFDFEDFSWLTFACNLPFCSAIEWMRWTKGRAGYKPVVFNISPHWICSLVILIFKKVRFWGFVHCGTEFCLDR